MEKHPEGSEITMDQLLKMRVPVGFKTKMGGILISNLYTLYQEFTIIAKRSLRDSTGAYTEKILTGEDVMIEFESSKIEFPLFEIFYAVFDPDSQKNA